MGGGCGEVALGGGRCWRVLVGGGGSGVGGLCVVGVEGGAGGWVRAWWRGWGGAGG